MGSNKPYPPEVESFITENAGKIPMKIISEMLIGMTGSGRYTYHAIHSWAKTRKIKTRVEGWAPPKKSQLLTDEQHELFKELNKGRTGSELSEELLKHGIHMSVDQIRSYRKNHSLPCGVDARYKVGHKNPPGHGRYLVEAGLGSRFQKGNVPKNKLPLGTEMVKDDGYIWVKVKEPRTWKRKHKLVWEAAHGKVRKGYMITFLDGDKMNTDLSNLAEISLAENAVMNNLHRRSKVPEITSAYIALTRYEQTVMNKGGDLYQRNPWRGKKKDESHE